MQPSNQAMLVGIRPTIGRISRYGVIPITADHDTAGPMARTVTDAAILLSALESASPDPNDPATKTCTPPPNRDYAQFLKRDSLKGARIGIPRAFYYESVQLPGEQRTRGGLNAEQQKAMARAIEVLKQQGAEIVDPVVIPKNFVDPDPKKNFLLWPYCSGANQAKGKDETCSVNFKYGMKRDFNQWLASLGAAAPVKTLTELRTWNLAHAKAGSHQMRPIWIDISRTKWTWKRIGPRNEADVMEDQLLSRTNGIDAVLMRPTILDAILTPASSAADLSARAGYPLIVVPFAMIPAGGGNPQRQNPYPAGFNPPASAVWSRLLPAGPRAASRACSGIAFAFEQATKGRVPPPLFP